MLTGATSVLATSQVTVCVELPGSETAVFGEVTRNGPAVFASRSVVSAKLLPPMPSRAVKRMCSASGSAFTPATPT